MFVLVARALLGVAVLAGLVSQYRGILADVRVPPKPPVSTTTVSSESAQPPTIEWQVQYQETPIQRVCRVTAYCDRGLTAAGVPSGVGQCAAPSDIPFGARVYIPALDRTFIVTDRTAKRFRHNTVDLFIPSRSECLEFGRQYLECEITLPAHPPRYGSPKLSAAIAANQS